jgi:hypothetical protein
MTPHQPGTDYAQTVGKMNEHWRQTRIPPAAQASALPG